MDFAFNPSAPLYFRPLWKLIIWGLLALFGGEGAAYHVAVVGLHAVDGFLAFLLARRFFRPTVAPWLAAVLFVAHPAYMWQATWLSAINEPLSVFFVLLAFLVLPEPGAPRYRQRHGLALLLLALALLAKESTVLMPVVAAALTLAQTGTNPFDKLRTGRASLWQATPCLALVAIYLLFRRVSGAGFEDEDYDFGFHGLANLRKYLGLLAFPWLHFLGEPDWDVQRAVFGAVPALVLWLAWRRGIMQAGLLGFWLVAALAPYLFFDFATPRYLYLAGLPFALLMAAAWDASEGASWGRIWPPKGRILALERGAVIAFTSFVLATAVWQMDNIVVMYDNYQEFRALMREALPQEPPPGSGLVIHYPTDFPNPLWGPDMNRSAFVWMVRYLYPGVSRVTFVGPMADLTALEVEVVSPEVNWFAPYPTVALPA